MVAVMVVCPSNIPFILMVVCQSNKLFILMVVCPSDILFILMVVCQSDILFILMAVCQLDILFIMSLHANFFRPLAPLSVIFRVRIAKIVLIFKPDPKNNRPIKSHVGIRPRTNMSTIFGRRSFRLQFCEALHYSCR
jgi:hypothetical protein